MNRDVGEKRKGIRDRRIVGDVGNFVGEDRDVEDKEGRSRKVRRGVVNAERKEGRENLSIPTLGSYDFHGNHRLFNGNR